MVKVYYDRLNSWMSWLKYIMIVFYLLDVMVKVYYDRLLTLGCHG